METNFSVIVTSYKEEKTEHFEEALFSLLRQSLQPSEIVVLFDGPGISEQKKVAEKARDLHPETIFKIIELKENIGRGRARNLAIKNTSFPLVAVMDSDDISLKDRFRLQLEIFSNKNVDLVASWQEEFSDNDPNYRKIKKCPENDYEIKRSLKFRCLIPNPSIMFKKEIFEKCGGYGENRFLGEDHMFFAKIAQAGGKFYCIQKPLIKVRIGPEQRKRRGGFRSIKEDYKLRNSLYRIGFINIFEFIYTLSLFTAFRLMPSKAKEIVFSIIRD